MIEKDLDKVLNYMKQYVENKYEHDSEPMLNWKDLQLVLKEIERLEKEKKELKDGWQEEVYSKNEVLNDWFECEGKINKLHSIIKEVREYIEQCQLGVDSRDRPVMLKYSEEGRRLLEILDKENKDV